jgi:FkbM family methyltransferase
MILKQVVRQFVPSSLWSGLQHAKANFSVWRFKQRSVTHNYGGHILQVHLHDPMSQQWYDCDWGRLKELDMLARSRLTKGAVVFDIGAHQCVVAMMLAREVGDSGTVIAVEPNPFNVRVAKLNLQSNDLKNVTQITAMVSSTSGMGVMSFELNARAASLEAGLWRRSVSSVTIDELSQKFGKPDVIYLDVEGYEFEALKAAGDVLTYQTDWCIELHGDDMLGAYGSCNSEIVKLFLTRKFEVYVSDGNSDFVQMQSESVAPKHRCHMVAIRSD